LTHAGQARPADALPQIHALDSTVLWVHFFKREKLGLSRAFSHLRIERQREDKGSCAVSFAVREQQRKNALAATRRYFPE
jgi:hypothetical protein